MDPTRSFRIAAAFAESARLRLEPRTIRTDQARMVITISVRTP